MKARQSPSLLSLAVAFIVFALSVFPAWHAKAAPGPGLTQTTWTAAEVGKEYFRFTNSIYGMQPTMIDFQHGYLFIEAAHSLDGSMSGKANWINISNPRNPQLITQTNVGGNKPHIVAFYRDRMIDGFQGRNMKIWDFDDKVLRNTYAGTVDPVWYMCQVPYVFRAANGYGTAANLMEIADITSGNGTRLALFDLGSVVPFYVGALHAIGNLLVCSASQAAGVATFDISDPANPKLLDSLVTGNPVYTSMVYGSRVYQCETSRGIRVFDFSDPTDIRQVGFISTGNNPRYVMLKEGKGYCAPGTSKIVVFDATTLSILNNWTLGGTADFVQLVGNMAFTGGHELANRCSLVPIQQAPDTNGPVVTYASPANFAKNQHVKSRVGFVMNDQIDITSLTTDTFIVRTPGGPALAGTYSTQLGMINFSPTQPLSANTTYEVVLPAGGIRDVASNAIAQAYSLVFSTGNSIDNALIAQWRLNNSSTDDTGKGHNLTLVSSPTFVTDRVEGSHALQFDGLDDYASAVSFDVSSNFSFAVWVKISPSRTNTQTIIANTTIGVGNGFKLFVNSTNGDGKIIFETGTGLSVTNVMTSAGVFQFGEWNHIAVTVNRSAGSAQVYCNATNLSATGAVKTNFATLATTYIGKTSNTQNFLGGILDDFRIYSSELTAVQVAELYAPGLLAHWPFENSGVDASGNLHEATLLNGAGYSTNSAEGDYSLTLDGTNDYATAGSLVLSNQFTVSLWAYIVSNSTNIQTLAANSTGGASANGFRFFVNTYQTANRKIILETGNGSTGNSFSSPTNTFALDAWNHVALVVNRSAGTGTIYYRGVAIASGTVRKDFSTNGNFAIGALNPTLTLKGNVDDFRIYNRALSDSEIAVLARPKNVPPVVQTFTASTTSPLVGQSVTFNATATDDNGDLLNYSFNFGDGSSPTAFTTNRNATHIFTSPGRYSVTVRVDDGSVVVSKRILVIAHYPILSPAIGSSQIIFDNARAKVWCVNPDSDTVSRIDAMTLAKELEIPVGKKPRSLAVQPGGNRIFVACEDAAEIWSLDVTNGAFLARTNLGHGIAPNALLFSTNGQEIFVSTKSGSVLKLNASTLATTGRCNVNGEPGSLSLTGDGLRLFAARFISPDAQGEVWEINPATMTLVRTLALAFDDTADGENSGRGVPNYLVQIALTPDNRRAWIPSKKDNIARGFFRDGEDLTHDSTVRSIISQLDLTTNVEVLNARRDVDDHSVPGGICFSPMGDLAYVVYQANNELRVFDTATGNSLSTVETPAAPQSVCVSPDGTRVFVFNFLQRSISAFDVSGLAVGTSSLITFLGETNVVATEKLSPRVLAGKKIFYNAADERMAREGYLTCISCHLDGGHDGRTWDFGDRGEGLRNTTDLRGRRGLGQGFVHWSANFNEIQDFEHDIRNGFGGTGLMDDADFNFGTRNTTLGTAKAGISADLDALADYVSSLTNFPASPHRALDGTQSLGAANGRQHFLNLQCNNCHGGDDFTDSTEFFLHDIGTLRSTSGGRLGGFLPGIDTPTLRGLWASAPYLHDGSAEDLTSVFNTTNASEGTAHAAFRTLSPTGQSELLAFLRELDGSDLAVPLNTNAPAISISSPATGTVFTSPTNISLLTFFSGHINNVAFYANGVLLGTQTNVPPYTTTFVWTNPPSGIFDLAATCNDLNGVTATSAVVSVFVNVGPPLTVSRSAQQLIVQWPASASAFQLYTTTNLTPPVQWLLWTNIQSTGAAFETIIPAGNSNQFFQLRTQ